MTPTVSVARFFSFLHRNIRFVRFCPILKSVFVITPFITIIIVIIPIIIRAARIVLKWLRTSLHDTTRHGMAPFLCVLRCTAAFVHTATSLDFT